jgi:hypothetical protein
MHRVFGAIAVFAAWICLPLSAILGLAATQFLGLTLADNPLPAYGVFGVPEVLVVALLGSVAVLSIAPLGSIIFSARPGRWVVPTAVVWGAIGVVLLVDELGRAHAAALLPGAFLLGAGARLIERADDDGEAMLGGRTTVPHEALEVTSAGGTVETAPATPAAVTAAPAPEAPPKRGRKKAGPAPKKSDGRVCPWCSAPIAPRAERCPGCGAALVEAPDAAAPEIAGVTTIDPQLLKYLEVSRKKSRRPGLVSLLIGEEDDRILPVGDGPAGVFAPPSPEVLAAMAELDREIASSRSALEATAEAEPEATAESAAVAAIETEPAADRATGR